MSAFALFPLVAIFYQFGWKQSVVAALLVLLSRLIVVRYFPHLFPESIEIFVGMVLLLGIAIFRDLKDRRASPTGEETSTPSMFEERTQRIINNLPLIAITGALISAVASIRSSAALRSRSIRWRKPTRPASRPQSQTPSCTRQRWPNSCAGLDSFH